MPSRRHSESDMNLIRTARKNMANSIDLMRQLGDDGVDTTPPDAMKSYDENGMEIELSPQAKRDEFLENAYESAVRFNGRWSHYEAHYFDANPFASEGIKCANCVFYRKATDAVGVCEIVEGAVSAEGICKLWIIPAELRAPEGMTEQTTNGVKSMSQEDARAIVTAWAVDNPDKASMVYESLEQSLMAGKVPDALKDYMPSKENAQATKSALDDSDTLNLEAVKASLRKALGR